MARIAASRLRRAFGAPARRAHQASLPLEYSILLTATFCLLATGAVMVYSAASPQSLAGRGDGMSYLFRFLMFGAAGLAAMRILARIELERVRALTPVLLMIAFPLLLAVLVPGLGRTINGARRWLGAGPLQFQPSELMKLALVLYTAHVLASGKMTERRLKAMVRPIAAVGGLACALVMAQPDLGTALVIGFTVIAMMFAAGVPARTLIGIVGGALVIVVLLAIISPYRRARLTSFINPWAHAGTSGFQAVQGQIALGSGGLLGVGPGQSIQKVFYLPEAHTDFILAVIGEELGAATVCGLMCLYGLIAYAGLRTAATRAKGAYASLLATGVTTLIVSQAALNAFAVLGLAPLTGVPLPFVSYGSSNLIVMLAGTGVLLNVASGGAAHLRAVRTPAKKTRGSEDERARRDSRGRDGGARRSGARRGRRAAGTGR